MNKLLTNKKINKVVKFIELIFLILIVIYLGLIIILKVSNSSSIGGYRLFSIETTSMKPEYNVNDVVIVKDVNTDTLKVGDDVTYRGERGGLEGLIITHRLIKIEKDGDIVRYYTQGVNEKNVDPSFTADRIIGKTIGVLPIITQINCIVKDQFGFFFLIFCPLIFIIFFEITETLLYIKLEQEELSLTQYIITQVKKGSKKTKRNNNEAAKVVVEKEIPVLIESTIEDIEVLKEKKEKVDNDTKSTKDKKNKIEETKKIEVKREKKNKKDKTKKSEINNKKNMNDEKEIPVLIDTKEVKEEVI